MTVEFFISNSSKDMGIIKKCFDTNKQNTERQTDMSKILGSPKSLILEG